MQSFIARVVTAADEIRRHLQESDDKSPFTLRNATIKGPLDLRHVVINRPVELIECEFLGEVDLRYAEFRSTMDLSSSTFHRHVNCGDPAQSHTIFAKDLLANATRFLGGGSFCGAQFCCSAGFMKASFEDPGQIANFIGCRFGKYADFNEAVFKGGAQFKNIECGLSATFIATRFESESEPFDISTAKIGNVLDCSDMVTCGGAIFDRVQCRTIYLQRARFESTEEPVMMEMMDLEDALHCDKALFAGPASFNGTCAEGAFFHEVVFHHREKRIDFRHSSCKVNLQLRKAHFCGPVTFESCKIDSKLILDRAIFQDEVSLCNATMKRLVLGTYTCFAEDSLDLRGCRFESIDDAKNYGLRLVRAQSGLTFSRDPYIQLENYFKSIGREADADEIYYRGRCAFRRHALDEMDPINWSKLRNFSDLVLKLLTGYGVKTERVIIPILVFLSLGVFLFLPDGMLQSAAGDAAGPLSMGERLFDRAAYSLDLFLPVVDLGVCGDWRPTTRWGRLYSVVHILAGWMLVPLLVASSSGLVRKR
jgi:hypothetical protein